MILVYDRDKKHESVVDQLFKPLGIQYNTTSKLSQNSIAEGTTAVIIFADEKIDEPSEEYIKASKRWRLLRSREFHRLRR